MPVSELKGKYHLKTEVAVNAPAESVWDVLADFSAPDTFAKQVTLAYSLTPDKSGLGEVRHCDLQGFGGIQETVIEWEEGRSLTYKVTPVGPLAGSVNRWSVVRASADRSRIVTEIGYDLRWWPLGWLLHALFMRRALKKALPQGPQALKERVESGRTLRPRRAPAGQPQLKPVGA